MKNNVKILLALALMIATIAVGVSSFAAASYKGENLNFAVLGGPVTIINPSADAIPVQLVGGGSRTFSLLSTIEGASGGSTKVGTGSTATQVFDFVLPAGSSEFTVARGTDVKFVATTPVILQATVNPVSNDTRRNTIIAMLLFTAGVLFYISRLTEHRFINKLMGREEPVLAPVPVKADTQERQIRGFGDNRSK